MADERYTRTNQKIYFAGLALEALKQAEQGQVNNAQALCLAGREAVLFHLYGAVLSLCHEIAGYYRLSQDAPLSVEVWLNSEAQAAEPTPERGEMLELAADKESWLARLLVAHRKLLQPPFTAKKAKVDPSLPLIQAVSVEQEIALEDAAELEDWRQALKTLVLQFRQALSEC